MIEGYFADLGSGVWPMISARVNIPGLGFSATVEFLVDTGGEWTTIGPRAAEEAGVPVEKMTPVVPIVGVGGDMPAVVTDAEIQLGTRAIPFKLYVMIVRDSQREMLHGVPSGLGRDILRHFTLVLDMASRRLVLLEPGETLQAGR
jgi:predicted aspartyl protease